MTMKKKFLGLMSAGAIAMAPMAFADGWDQDAGAADDQYEAEEQEGFDQGEQDQGFDQGGQGEQDQGFDQGGQDDAAGQDPYGEEEDDEDDDQPDEW